MDMLETGNYEQAAHANGRESNMSAVEYKTEFSMWAISASPMIVTTPLMNCTNATGPGGAVGPVKCPGWISDLQKEILFNKEVLAINQDVTPQGRPLDPSDLSVWGRKLSDGSWAVALYNQDEAEADLAVDFGRLGLTKASVRDLWAHADLGVFDGAYPAKGSTRSVAAHATVLLRLTPA
jgi:alpha-galactosidase